MAGGTSHVSDDRRRARAIGGGVLVFLWLDHAQMAAMKTPKIVDTTEKFKFLCEEKLNAA